MLAIVRDVGSPWFGAWMDTGNFHSEDVYAELAQIAPYTIHVQVKVVTSEKGRGRRPMDGGGMIVFSGKTYGGRARDLKSRPSPHTPLPTRVRGPARRA